MPNKKMKRKNRRRDILRGGTSKDAAPSASKSMTNSVPSLQRTWWKLKDWINLSQIFILIGVGIFTIAQTTGNSGGDLAAYIWFALCVLATWILSMREMAIKNESNNKDSSGIFAAFSKLSILFPTLATLLPLVILIYVYSALKTTLDENMQHLPNQFFWFNRFTFFLMLLQLFFLGKYYTNILPSLLGSKQMKEEEESGKTKNQNIWIAALILMSILSSAAAIELYVLITAFITDG